LEEGLLKDDLLTKRAIGFLGIIRSYYMGRCTRKKARSQTQKQEYPIGFLDLKEPHLGEMIGICLIFLKGHYYYYYYYYYYYFYLLFKETEEERTFWLGL
jgi:hypothetical protein